MIPVPYFPLASENFVMRMGVQPLGENQNLIEIDWAEYEHELAQKQQQLHKDYANYAQLPPHTLPAQWEAALYLMQHLSEYYPQHFGLEKQGAEYVWHNMRRNQRTVFAEGDPTALGCPPLEFMALQVQEDLCLLDANQPDIPLVAGVVCFPSDWTIAEKVNQPFVQVHAPVPLFAPTIAAPSVRLLDKLKPGRPVWRPNWSGLKPTPQLDVTPKHAAMLHALKHTVTLENCADQLHFRVEYQTLSKLPQTNTVLFTIRTYVSPLREIAQNPAWARYTLGWLRTAPAEWLAYKGLATYAEMLQVYLAGWVTTEGS